MLKKISLLFILTVFFCSTCYAGDAQPVLALVRAHVEGMEAVKPALLRMFQLVDCHDVWDILNNKKENTLSRKDIPALISALEKFNKRLTEAAMKYKPLVDSQDESVKTAAERAKNAYEQLAKDNEDSVQNLRLLKKKQNTPEELNNISYTIESNIGEFTSSLYFASDWVVEAVNKVFPDKEKTGYPRQERKEIAGRLAAIYRVDKNKKNEISMLEGYHFCNAVVNLYEQLK